MRRHPKASSAGPSTGGREVSPGRGRLIPYAVLGALVVLLCCGVASGSAATYVPGTPATFCSGVGSAPGQCQELKGVAVDSSNGNVYVVDANSPAPGNFRISQYTSTGTFVRGFGVAVADGATLAPQVCTTTCFPGKETGAAGAMGTGARGIAVDPSTHIVYIVAGANKVAYYNGSTGVFLGEFVAAGTPGAGQVVASPPAPQVFSGLTGVGVDSSGPQHYLYVATGNGSTNPYVIDKFKVPNPSTSTPPAYVCQITGQETASASECHGTPSKDGAFNGLSLAGQVGATMAVDGSGNVFVAEGNSRNVISMFDSTGGWVKAIGATAPVAVASGAPGKIFVADRGTSAGAEKVEEFDTATGAATSEISLATATSVGIAVDTSGLGSNGNVYAAEKTGKQLRKYATLILRALSIVKNGSGVGEVKCKFNGGALENCSSPQQNGTSVEVIATPDVGSDLASISGTGSASGCSASPCSFTIEADSSVTTTFNLQPGFRSFSVVKTGAGSGAVECKVGAGSFGPCGSAYPEGTSVSVQAVPAPASSQFSGWSVTGAGSTTCAGAANPCQVVIGGTNVTVNAQFTPIPRTLSIVKNGTGTGTVECKFNEVGSFGPCASPQPNGTVVRVKATPSASSELTALTGNGSATGCAGAPCVFTIEANTTVTATFDLAARNLTINKVGIGDGSFTCKVNAGSFGPCASTYINGQTIVIKAVPNGLSLFQEWTGCSSRAGNECTVIAISADTTVTAAFTPLPAVPEEPTLVPSVYRYGTSAIFAGAVDPNNSAMNYHFEYVDDADFQANGFTGATSVPSPDASAGFGGSAVSVAKEVTGLTPGTTYHLRLVASNGAGSAASAQTTFTVEASGTCANEAIRKGQDSAAQKSGVLPGGTIVKMPACMALEMASPPSKENQPVKNGNQANNSISVDGDHVFFRTGAALGETNAVANIDFGDVYIASRNENGWTTKATILRPMGGGSDPKGLAPDLRSWFQIAPETTDLNNELKYQAWRSTLGGSATAFSSLLLTAEQPQVSAEYAGSSEDGSHLYIKLRPSSGAAGGAPASARLLSNDPKPAGALGELARPNIYATTLGGDGQPAPPELLARDRFGKAWGANCGARIGGDIDASLPAELTSQRTRVQGAISKDGSRVYFSTRPSQPDGVNCNGTNNRMRILERAETPLGPVITDLVQNECTRISPACDATDGDDYFQSASADGNRVYFVTNRQLVNSDLDSGAPCGLGTGQASGCDLYLYEKLPGGGHKLVQVSAGDATDPTPGSGAKVLNNIAGISTDGSHVYFAAEGVLTTEPNELGAVAQAGPGQINLYLYERDSAYPNGRTAFIGALNSGDTGELWGSEKIEAFGPSSVWPVPAMDADGEIGGDGHVLLFRSKAQLTPNDTDGTARDVYRYDSQTGSLQCVSCLPGSDGDAGEAKGAEGAGLGNGRPQGPAFASLGRWVSEDGDSVVFQTAAPLLPGDINSDNDEYLWRDGQLTRLPGADFEDAPTISGNGSAVLIDRAEQLLPQDGDSVADVYVLRSGGGFPIPPVKEICVGEGCQEPFRSQPSTPTAASETVSGENVIEPAPCKKGFVRRKGKCVPAPCKKGFVRRKGKCVKRHGTKKHHSQKNRAAGNRQGGLK